MAWRVEISGAAKKSLKQLDPQAARRILHFLNERVATTDNPRRLGEALRGPELGKYWKYRVGDYRVIADIQDAVLTVLVVRIGNRREIYR